MKITFKNTPNEKYVLKEIAEDKTIKFRLTPSCLVSFVCFCFFSLNIVISEKKFNIIFIKDWFICSSLLQHIVAEIKVSYIKY